MIPNACCQPGGEPRPATRARVVANVYVETANRGCFKAEARISAAIRSRQYVPEIVQSL